MHTAAPPSIRRYKAGWLVPSASMPGKYRYVERRMGRWRCTCPSGARKGTCHHLTAVQQALNGGEPA
jgi:hypothetical protein